MTVTMTRSERDAMIRTLGQETSRLSELKYRRSRGICTADTSAEIAVTEKKISTIADLLYPPMPEGGAS